MDRHGLGRGALALLMAAVLVAAQPDAAWADSKDKAKGAAKAPAARPAAPVSQRAALGPASTPTARPSVPTAEVAAQAPTAVVEAGEAVESDGGTMTTEEARNLLLSGGAVPGVVAPPVATVDPLSLITPVRRVTVPQRHESAPDVADQSAGEASYFPVPWPVLAVLLALSNGALVLGIRMVRRLGAEPVGQVSAAG